MVWKIYKIILSIRFLDKAKVIILCSLKFNSRGVTGILVYVDEITVIKNDLKEIKGILTMTCKEVYGN